MEFTEDFVKQHNLTPEQIAAVKTFGSDYIANEKKAWDDKIKEEGNQYATGILDGAAKRIEEMVKIPRVKGEKLADYYVRVGEEHVKGKQSELDTLKAQLEEKIKAGGGDEALKAELSTLKSEIDRLKKIEAEFEPMKGVKDQYDELEKKYGSLKLETAFGNARPSFPESVNKYEADVKWANFKNGVLAKYNIEIVEGESIAIDKDNEHKRYKLSELADKDPELSELMKGRQQSGSGTKAATELEIEGVPFKVPENATSEEKSKILREHLLTVEKLDATSEAFSKRFAELYGKIRGGAK